LLHHKMMLIIMSSPPITRVVPTVAAIMLLSFLIPAVSPAATLSGNSSTYVQSQEAIDGTKILSGFEYLDIAVQNVGDETISFHMGGWGRYYFSNTPSQEPGDFGQRSYSDLQYSYLSFKSKSDNTIVNLGRVMVFEGVAAERVDGIYARTDLRGGFGVSVFGGSPVETNINLPGNNVIYGGRVSHEVPNIYRLGLSALQEDKDSSDWRKEAGMDIWLHPYNKVDITGRSSYNDITHGWMENTYVLMLGPFAKLRLDTTASWINYNDYFFHATTSAFTLAPGHLQPNEKVCILGEAASYPVTNTVLITADYKNYHYDIEGTANYYGGMIRYSVSESGGAGIGYHRMDGETDRLKYNEYRVYGYKKFGNLNVTADGIEVVYDQAINGVTNSYTGTLAAQYAFTQACELGADVSYSHNPEFSDDTRAFIKLLYHFDLKGGT
jgi:hypothetical protein